MHLDNTFNVGTNTNGVATGEWEITIDLDVDMDVFPQIVCVNPPVANTAPTTGVATTKATVEFSPASNQ